MSTIRQALEKLVSLEDQRIRLRMLHERGFGTDYDSYHKAVPDAWHAARTALAEQPATQGEDVLAQIRAIVDEWDETGRGPGIKLNEISYILGTPPGKPEQPDSEPSDANMFWNDADPERCRYSIHEILDDEWGDGILQAGETRVIQRAIRLANITVLIVSDPDDEDSFDYEILDDAAILALRTKEAT